MWKRSDETHLPINLPHRPRGGCKCLCEDVVTLAEKIIKHIDEGWSPRVAARKAGTTEYRLMQLSRVNKELRIKMDLHWLGRLNAKRIPEGNPVEIEFVDKRKGRRATRVDRYLPVNSPIYKRRMSRFGE